MHDLKGEFQRDVVAAFSAVEKFGFVCIKSSEENVVLENSQVVIQIHYDRRRSFEVGIEISTKEKHPRLEVYSLRDVFREMGVPDADRHSFFQSQDYQSVLAFLEQTAQLFEEYAKSLLCGDISMFYRLEERQSREAKAYTLKVQLMGVRKQADEAWKAGNYQKFLDLLGEFKDALSPADQKKLAYAAKKTSGC